jgi:hypothetical protein
MAEFCGATPTLSHNFIRFPGKGFMAGYLLKIFSYDS